ncbi:MAG: 5-methylthioadenosine/S-adenosylhomocysteine deaminase [Candidatus Roseilinea sp.]|nr:MAG: 5-methylthioadenosine/S-adenosylhomocysteine deaminase [Candidatus Roseilinea sp.]
MPQVLSTFDLLIAGCDVLIRQDGKYVVVNDRDIVIAGNRIAAIVPTETIDRAQAREVIDASGLLAIPGLINCHTHAPMVLFRGLAEDVTIEAWFNDYIWPLESNEEPEDIYWGALLAIAEMIQSGVTTFADHYFFCDEIAEAVDQAGVRANIGWAVFGHEGEAKLNQTVDFARRWQGGAGGRITTWLAPHSPYLCDRDFLALTAQHAKALNTGIHIHCSETHDQVALSLKQHGVTPPFMLQQAGVLDVPVLLAHGIALTPEDIAMLKDHDVAVAQCPKTYMKLAMGTAPVRAMREAGITVGIGTDGVVSSNTLDVLEQMRLLALDQKQAMKDSTTMPLQAVMEIAFAGSAAALRLPGIGELAEGKLADIALLRQEGAHLFPRYDAIANLVYSAHAGDVDTVICDGKLLMRYGRLLTVDLPHVKAEITCRLQRLNQRVAEKRLATYPT